MEIGFKNLAFLGAFLGLIVGLLISRKIGIYISNNENVYEIFAIISAMLAFFIFTIILTAILVFVGYKLFSSFYFKK